MALQSTGAISFNNINVELGLSGTTTAPINQAPFRTLAGKPGSGTTIALSDFYGKANRVTINLTLAGGNVLNYDVYDNRGPTYVAGTSDITVTIPAPTIVGSVSTPTYSLSVPSVFNPADTVTIVNNGTILGAGGAGGRGGDAPGAGVVPATVGLVGGNAVFVNRPTIITNNGTIAGGGGGGGSSAGQTTTVPGPPKGSPSTFRRGGSGGGGGAGLNSVTPGIGGAGGLGGVPGGASGTPGTTGSGGAGIPVQTFAPNGATVGPSGPGGGRGAVGVNAGTPGGGAGNYITGNPFVTWPVTGTRLGGVA